MSASAPKPPFFGKAFKTLFTIAPYAQGVTTKNAAVPDRFLKPQNTTQRIVGALVGTSAIAIATMIGMTVWLTTATNETTAEKSRKIVANAMTATLETLEWSIADYALWSDAHAIVDAMYEDHAGHDHHRGHDGSDKSDEDDAVHRDTHAQEHLNQVFDAVYIIG